MLRFLGAILDSDVGPTESLAEPADQSGPVLLALVYNEGIPLAKNGPGLYYPIQLNKK
jgi:hypothetical protein